MSDGVVFLDKYMDSANLVIKGNAVLNAINLHNNLNLNIKIEDGAAMVLNMFDYAVSLDVHIDIEANDNSSFQINSSFICENKYSLDIETKLYGSAICGEVNVRGINEKEGTVKVVMNGTVAGETKGNVLNEYAKVLNKSELSNVLIPNLIVNTNEVEANHGVSIGKIDDNELFYLMSKGINKYHAVKIIEEGFILSIMPDDIKEKIKNILVGR